MKRNRLYQYLMLTAALMAAPGTMLAQTDTNLDNLIDEYLGSTSDAAETFISGASVADQSRNIVFADPAVKALCVANWDTDEDGELSTDEAAAVYDLGTVFFGNKNITSFDELQYFTGLYEIGESAFSGCSNLQRITIPAGVVALRECSFYQNYVLSTVTFAEGSSLRTIENNVFYNCGELSSLNLPEGLEEIGANVFKGGSRYLASAGLPSTVTTVGAGSFDGALKTLMLEMDADVEFGAGVFGAAEVIYVPSARLNYYKALLAEDAEKYAWVERVKPINPNAVDPDGDVDGDGNVTIADVKKLVSKILSTSDSATIKP